MPVVGRGDDHGVNRVVVQSAAKILGELGRVAALRLGHAIAPRRLEAGVSVAQIVNAAVGPLGETGGER